MSRTAPKLGDLAAAAHALEIELQAVEDAVAEGTRVHLNTRKGLERLARDLTRGAEAHDRLQQRLAELATQLAAIQARTEGAGTGLLQLGGELGRRQEAYAALVAAYDAVVQDAVAVGAFAKDEPTALVELRGRLHAVAARAGTLAEEARAAGFRDLAEDATARHQQLASLANKLGAAE